MRFTKTNDLISTDFVSVDPPGFEFGYTDLVLSAGVGNFQNIQQLDSTENRVPT
jgi:hypothetical protein